MTIPRRALLIAAALMMVGAALPATAADRKVVLTAVSKKTLLALKPLRDQGADRALFDGKPLLVAFFASW